MSPVVSPPVFCRLNVRFEVRFLIYRNKLSKMDLIDFQELLCPPKCPL